MGHHGCRNRDCLRVSLSHSSHNNFNLYLSLLQNPRNRSRMPIRQLPHLWSLLHHLLASLNSLRLPLPSLLPPARNPTRSQPLPRPHRSSHPSSRQDPRSRKCALYCREFSPTVHGTLRQLLVRCMSPYPWEGEGMGNIICD